MTDQNTAEGRLDLKPGEWKRVSPRYVMIELVGAIITGVILCGVSGVLLALDFPAEILGVRLALIALVAAIILTVILLVVAPRRARSIGYLLRDDDLLFRRGIMYQRFVAVPYGRMQLIDIYRGPLGRALGLSDLKFVTAAATTAVSIPGLADADAEELRDTLVSLAESRRAGL